MKRHLYWAIGYLIIAMLFTLYAPIQRAWPSLWGADLWLIAGFMTLNYGGWCKTTALIAVFTGLIYSLFDFLHVESLVVLSINLLVVWAVAFLFKHYVDLDTAHSSPAYLALSLIKFVLVPSLFFGVTGAYIVSQLSSWPFAMLIESWLEGTVVMLLIGLPLILFCTRTGQFKFLGSYTFNDALWSASTVVITYIAMSFSWLLFTMTVVILLALCAVFKGVKTLSLVGFILGGMIVILLGYDPMFAMSAIGQTKVMLLFIVMAGFCNALIICMHERSKKCVSPSILESDDSYIHTFELSPIILASIDSMGRIMYVSDGFMRCVGYKRNELLGKAITNFLREDSALLVLQKNDVQNSRILIDEVVLMNKEGDEVTCLLEVDDVGHDESHNYKLCFFQDISERKKLAEELSSEKELLEVTLSSIGDGVICTDVNSNVTYMNPVAEAITAKLTSEVVGQPFQDVMQLFNEDTLQPIENLTHYCMRKNQTIGLPDLTCVKNHLGLTFAIQDSISPIYGKHGQILGSVMVFQDVTESRVMSRKMNHLAHHDALTGLPNRLLLQDRLIQACKRAQRCKHQFALVFIDLDKFKKINDSLGHDYGDLLLKQVAERLAGCVRACDTISRMGGDEFVLLLDAIEDKRHVRKVIKKVLTSTAGDYELKGIQFAVSLSAGIAIYPDDGDNAEILMKHADTAMYRAKKVSKTDFQFYSTKLDHEAEMRVEVEAAISKGIEHQEFTPYYQPIVNAKNFELEKLEMLARWQQRDQLVTPPHFIAIAEDANVISTLSYQLLHQALPQFAKWLIDKPSLILSINISVQQLCETHFIHELVDLARQYGVPTPNLEIEITESSLVSNIDRMQKIFDTLQEKGFKVSIDDFGTGFSSLNYLKHLAFDTLKVDPSFVDDLTGAKNNGELAIVIVNMAKSLQVNCVAEGVENAIQAKTLASCGCDQLQGHFFSKPIDAVAMTDLIRRGQVFSSTEHIN